MLFPSRRRRRKNSSSPKRKIRDTGIAAQTPLSPKKSGSTSRHNGNIQKESP